jgi:hypothetical protein
MKKNEYDTDEDIEQMENFVVKHKQEDDEFSYKEMEMVIYKDNKIQCLTYKKVINVITLAAILGIFAVTPIVLTAIDKSNLAIYFNMFEPRFFQVNFAVFIILWLIVICKIFLKYSQFNLQCNYKLFKWR